jgi:hypothetical protein
MAPPFEANWATLELEGVAAFLNRELEEGLTWEAKGSHEIRPEQIRKAVSGFANAIGGSLILGAERDGGAWRLPGFDFPGGEAKPWLSNIIRELTPVPRYDIKVFSTTNSRLVAIVAVEPIDVPPCMSGGSVFERVSGQTIPVTDPRVLRELFSRGEATRERALELARWAASTIYVRPLSVLNVPFVTPAEAEQPRLRQALGLAIAPVSWPSASGRAVLRASYAERLRMLLAAREVGGLRPPPATAEPSRASVQAVLTAHYGRWVVRVYAQGAAAVTFSSERFGDEGMPIRVADVMSELASAWTLAAGALENAGAAGEAFLALHIQSPLYPPHEGTRISPPPTVDIARAIVIGTPTEAELDSIRRELEREAGYPTWEPEPGD